MNKLNFYLDAHFEDVWEMLHTPAHLLGIKNEAEGAEPAAEENQISSSSVKPEGPSAAAKEGDQTGQGGQPAREEQPADAPNVKLDFYKNVLAAVAGPMLEELSVQKA